ncbi:MAG: V-type ATPase subunit [Clostridia bacterium]|nr:V-type ATPase subunit [Clostridia bacterium]
MAMDPMFTNGVIAVKEKYFLRDKLTRMCEMGAEDAFRLLIESGFGQGAVADSYREYEALLEADEKDTDKFIRDFAPSAADAEYLLAPRDFHNAKAIVKADIMGVPVDRMLAPEGSVPVDKIKLAYTSGDTDKLPEEMARAFDEVKEYLAGGDKEGAEIGIIFDKALYRHLAANCKRPAVLRKFVAGKADMQNILTCMRSSSMDYAKKYLVEGGSIKERKLAKLFESEDEGMKAMSGTGLEAFARMCYDAKAEKKPLSEAEKVLESYETDSLAKNRFDLKASEPFLYYIFRRRAENENVRIVMASLIAGMPEKWIKERLRGVQV